MNLPFDPIERAHDNWTRRWGPSPAMAAVTSVMRAQQILIGELDGALKPFGLTFARYEALVLLTFSGSGSLPLGKIGERLMVHPTSVTNTIDRLEGQGFVRRLPNPSDGRGVLAEITDAGRRVTEEATGALLSMDFGLGCYSDEELWRMHEMFTRLRVDFGDFPEPVAEAAEGR
ncbi:MULTISPECIES: MarR family winged helix-turn-helix transcriptional regulator [Nocardiopsis]|uniref:MarR family transcriptional regulator n=1 Tax=Nocardiopsis alborubida TaxID=146802 RepID=A0A7X6RQT7_9ACTN|nr:MULTISPECIES: MarR family transcriptional regulator [Nocardiopsis]NKY98587.1 MarR family transcriptional regulator [Nocardiopsis alborubida]WDZ93823.1 MarR family transcriptional regulator [Nocardiopsis sp. HUAS JQ3]